MQVKVSELSTMYWRNGQLVWDDYIRHAKYILTSESERVIHWFSSWREIDSISVLGKKYLGITAQLIMNGILIVKESREDTREEKIVSTWSTWGNAAISFHFASSSISDTIFVTLDENVKHKQKKILDHLQPSPFKNYQGCELISIPAYSEDNLLPEPTFVKVLENRKSVRQFSDEPIAMARLGKILSLTGGIKRIETDLAGGVAVFKNSPSAGASNPFEIYVYARRVNDLAPGLYHYAPNLNGLELIDPLFALTSHNLGGQPWLLECAALILFTSVIERSQWQYETCRAYRDLLIGLGHLSQTLQLAVSAMEYGSVFATAVCDEEIEQLMGLSTGEVLLGTTAIGVKPMSAI
jgi:SagB-type dehydrogenase family enzyme